MSPDAALRGTGLVWFPDDRPGIRRERRGRGFSYVAPDGTRISRGRDRKRIEALGVPPAYDDVWICPEPNGHLQATGRDARRRKQYRYHAEWTEMRSATKFAGLASFGRALPDIRAWIARGLSAPVGDQDLAIALVLRLIDGAGLRIGHARFTAENGTFGATTLRERHVNAQGRRIELSFPAKGGRQVNKSLDDRTLARALTRIEDLPGVDLAVWTDDDGQVRRIRSHEVNQRLTDLAGGDTTAKDFRTWHGTVAALEAAIDADRPTITAMTEAAARRLHNTPAVCRRSYIHPAVISLAEGGTVPRRGGPRALDGMERRLVRLLETTD